jgi:hypothetical protein
LIWHSRLIILKKFIDLVASLWNWAFFIVGAGQKNLIAGGLQMPNVADLSFGGGDVWWFMSVILLGDWTPRYKGNRNATTN